MSIRLGCSLLLSLATVVGAPACRDEGDLDESFYYPIDELHQGLVYVYETPGTSQGPPQYWYLRSLETPDSTMLISTLYSPDYQPLQLTNERIVATGSLLRELRLYTPTDSASNTLVAEILQPALFSFEAPDVNRVLVSVMRLGSANEDSPADVGEISFRQNPPARPTYTLTRNRRYVRDTTFAWENAELPAQLWSVRELMEHDSVGVLAVESAAIEIYAAGLGLVYRERRFPNGESEAYRLTRRMPMDSLIAEFSTAAQ